MRGEEVDEGIEIQRLRRSIAAPILKGVPGLRSGQDKNGAVGVFEIVRIVRDHERPGDRGSRFRPRVLRDE